MTYILITGSRELNDAWEADEQARLLLTKLVTREGSDDLHIMHGGAPGWDSVFQALCDRTGLDSHVYPAKGYTSPLIRNEVMVEHMIYARNLGHRVECWAFAKKWASGTGHCARRARLAGIKTIDFGVDTTDPRSPF